MKLSIFLRINTRFKLPSHQKATPVQNVVRTNPPNTHRLKPRTYSDTPLKRGHACCPFYLVIGFTSPRIFNRLVCVSLLFPFPVSLPDPASITYESQHSVPLLKPSIKLRSTITQLPKKKQKTDFPKIFRETPPPAECRCAFSVKDYNST